MDASLIFTYCILTMIWMIALCSMTIIWTYLANKALGMQTMFDVMIKDLVLVSLITMATASSTNIELGVAWNPYLARFAIVLNFFAAFAFFTQIFNTILIRYLSVFHGAILNEWNEKDTVLRFRVLTLALSVGSSLYEVLVNDYGKGPLFLHMIKDNESENAKQKHYVTLELLMLLVLVTIVCVQAKIEWFKYKAKPITCTQQNNFEFKDIIAVRTSSILTIIIILLTMAWIFASVFVKTDDVHLARLRIHVLTSCLLFNIFPLIVIRRNANITEYVSNIFANAFNINMYPVND